VSLSIVSVLRKVAPNLSSMDAYELSARGPLFHYLNAQTKTLTCSEYFDDLVPGEFRNGIQCQDVQRLTFPAASFDLCTSTEVFEHVPNDGKAFCEMFRVLRPGGILVFTVPLRNEDETLERAVLSPTGEIKHLFPPEYHGDPLHGSSGRILAFRTYGQDVIRRLLNAGFADAKILYPEDHVPWGYARSVIVGYKDIRRAQIS
jgi:SAM-dependent methyltransferase